MKKFLALALFLLVTYCTTPIKAGSDSGPYVAVFCNPGWEIVYKKFQPDLMWTARREGYSIRPSYPWRSC